MKKLKTKRKPVRSLKLLRFSKWLLIVLALLSAGVLIFLLATGDSYKKMRAVGVVTEDLICDIAFVSAPFLAGLSALTEYIIIKKRCYGRRLLAGAMAAMFALIGLMILLINGIRTDRLIRTLKSPDGEREMYYVQEYNDQNEPDRMRLYRRTDMFTYEAVFSIDNDRKEEIRWSGTGVGFDGKKGGYSSYIPE